MNHQQRSREEKYFIFLRLIQPSETDRVLVMGSGDGSYFCKLYPYKHRIVAVDHDSDALKRLKAKYPQITTFWWDLNKELPYGDKSFDICFSNAVIEHLKEQKVFASEIERLSKSYFVSCPNKLFPFEMHYRLPLYQWVPEIMQRWLSARFSIGNFPRGEWEKIRLLTPNMMRRMFPCGSVTPFYYGYNLIAWRKEKW